MDFAKICVRFGSFIFVGHILVNVSELIKTRWTRGRSEEANLKTMNVWLTKIWVQMTLKLYPNQYMCIWGLSLTAMEEQTHFALYHQPVAEIFVNKQMTSLQSLWIKYFSVTWRMQLNKHYKGGCTPKTDKL